MCRFASHLEITDKHAAGLQKRETRGADDLLKHGNAAAAGDDGIRATPDGSARTIFHVGVEDPQATVDAA